VIGLEDRQEHARDIQAARDAGARLQQACEVVGITARTLQRWSAHQGLESGDGRPTAVRPVPSHALSEAERAEVLRVANEPRFADMPPARIVPMLADEGVYIASESTFARVLRAQGQHRGRAKAPRKSRPPTTHIATAPRQLWCWDMTFLPAEVTGRWFFLYLILDVYSRKIVGFEVHEDDDSDHAARLVQRTALAEGIHAMPRDARPVLHGDNGATLKATTVLAMLWWLGVKPSYSRPRVSDDNAFVESLFRTAKYRPEFPDKGFADLGAAREWAREFVHWYNHDHRHSGIRYVSPAQRHEGADVAILAARHEVYLEARQRNPARWSGPTRDWSHIACVTLNPERDSVAAAASRSQHSQPLAA
jgi:transposase InsO family protein